jgi:hypothetical protein
VAAVQLTSERRPNVLFWPDSVKELRLMSAAF